MNGYIALKPITLSGIDYAAGDSIPADAVLPSRVPALIRTKSIAHINERPAEAQETPQNDANDFGGVNLPIKTENGVLELPASGEDIVKAVELLQMNADDAIQAIKEIESDSVLIIMDACDSRKTVKAAAKARAKELNEEKDPEGTTDPEGQNGADGTDSEGDADGGDE